MVCKSPNPRKKMAQKHYKTIINTNHTAGTSGSAEFVADDYSRLSLAIATVGGSAVSEYRISLYPSPETPDAQAVVYASTIGATAGAVAYFDNISDAQGVPFVFYKIKVEWEDLGSGGLVAAVACY
jgi:hypothetical protein